MKADVQGAGQAPAAKIAEAPLWRRFLPLGLLVLALAAVFLSGATKYLSVDYFLQSRAGLAAFTRDHLLQALLAYAALYVAVVTLSIPGALLLTIAGGFLFGGWLGGLVAVIAASAGATCLFLVARSSLGSSLGKRAGPWIERLRAGFAEDAASYMLFLRLVPVFPFWLVNLAPALLGVPLRTFIWTTLLGVIPGTLVYALAGAGLDSVLTVQKQAHDACLAAGNLTCKLDFSPGALVTREMILAFAAAGLAALIPVLLKKMAKPERRGAHGMTDVLTPDLCIIGAGSGGLSVAAAAAAMGVPTVLIEKGEMGGDCLNYGCVPSKALIAAGHAAQTMREAARFGIHAVEPRIDMAKVHAHVHGVIAAIAHNDSEARFTAMGVKVIRAAGKFISGTALEAGGHEIRARRFIIATGSSAAVPPIPGLDQVRYLTNETVFDLKDLPSRLIIIGGGPIGVELAQAFRRLGSDVIVLEGARALSREDPELAAVAIARLRAEGVDIREGVKILRIEARGAGARIVLAGHDADITIDGSHLLVAAGRNPNVNNLGLEQAGVAFDRKGIKVSGSLRTANRRIYAIGDVTGEAAFTHAANYHAGLVLRATLFRLSVKVEPQLIPRVTYTDPEIAVAGLTEAQARETHKSINVYRWPFVENDRAQAEHATQGHIKVIASTKDVILGAGIAGRHAGELILPWQMAVAKKMKVQDMAGMVFPYPTLSEVSKRAAGSVYLKSLGNPWLGKALRFLRRFG